MKLNFCLTQTCPNSFVYDPSVGNCLDPNSAPCKGIIYKHTLNNQSFASISELYKAVGWIVILK